MTDPVARSLAEHLAAAQAFQAMAADIRALATVWWRSLSAGGAVWFCGNGGSAGDSQHLAAELSGRFETERRALRAGALTVDTSALTAIANDYGYEQVFARQLQGLARPGDTLVCISTSGNAPAILRAAESARALGVTVCGMTGAGGGKLAPLCDTVLKVPSTRTARIQELHILAGHCCCELIDGWEAERVR
jgi:D-sedoheptulose 7-phosphate isomerase